MKRFICKANVKSSNATAAKHQKLTTSSELNILNEIFCSIFENYIPVYEWPQLMLVSRQFHKIVLLAYNSLKSLCIYDLYSNEYKTKWCFTKDKVFKSVSRLNGILKAISKLCSKLHELHGFDCVSRSIELTHLNYLLKFDNLSSIAFNASCKISVKHFSEFLKQYSNLQELNLDDCFVNESFSNDPDLYLKPMENISGLRSLTLSGLKHFTGSFLSIVKTEQLEILDFRRLLFKNLFVFEFIERCAALRGLVLFESEEHEFQSLPNLPRLETLIFIVNTNFGIFSNPYGIQDLVNAVHMCKNMRKFTIIDMNGRDMDVENGVVGQFTGKNVLTESFPGLKSFVNYCSSFELDFFQTGQSLSKPKKFSVRKLSATLKSGDLTSLFPLLENITVLHLNFRHQNNVLGLLSFITLKRLREFFVEDINPIIFEYWDEKGFVQQLTVFGFNGSVSFVQPFRSIMVNGKNLKRLLLIITNSCEGAQIHKIIAWIAEHCTMLEQLSICSNYYHEITNDALLFLLKSCNRLTELNINYEFVKKLISCDKFAPFKPTIKFGKPQNEFNSLVIR